MYKERSSYTESTLEYPEAVPEHEIDESANEPEV